ncbi:MAG: AraC family transcriptional regulator [Alphaproteobacteria bacterium]|nr:AraC family transcriptional regulator [Alphaproteobacteria bacterium]
MSVTSKAVWYVEAHLTQDSSLDAIADAIGVSRFHLSRTFGLTQSQPLASYIRARRLSEAAKTLAGGAEDILSIALDAGYGSHEAFTRAFRMQFGTTPEQVRSAGATSQLSLQEAVHMNGMPTTSITAPRLIKANAMKFFGLGQRYVGMANAGIPSQWDKFIPHFGQIPGQVGRISYGLICHSDDDGGYEYICGVEVTAFPPSPSDFTRVQLPARTYAVFDHRDHISAIHATMRAIWNEALPASGHVTENASMFERYDERFNERTGFGGVEIWVPIKG